MRLLYHIFTRTYSENYALRVSRPQRIAGFSLSSRWCAAAKLHADDASNEKGDETDEKVRVIEIFEPFLLTSQYFSGIV
jgi:hypothetical protein